MSHSRLLLPLSREERALVARLHCGFDPYVPFGSPPSSSAQPRLRRQNEPVDGLARYGEHVRRIAGSLRALLSLALLDIRQLIGRASGGLP